LEKFTNWKNLQIGKIYRQLSGKHYPIVNGVELETIARPHNYLTIPVDFRT
jgi:hypothetical protein